MSMVLLVLSNCDIAFFLLLESDLQFTNARCQPADPPDPGGESLRGEWKDHLWIKDRHLALSRHQAGFLL